MNITNKIFWKGLGPIAVFIAIFVLFLVQGIANLVSGDAYFSSKNTWLYLVAGTIAGIVIWFVGKYLNSRPPKHVLDPKTNKKIVVKQEHSLFSIKFEKWAFIVAASAVIFSLPD